jgi:NitT/TauT family transport system substrate-binding protein
MIRTIVLLLAMLLAAPASAEDAVSFRLNWYMGGAHAPFFLGKERGFYHDAGIDLTINEGRGSANTAQVVAAGTDTFGLADSSSVMRLVSKDAPIRTVMSLLNTSSFGVISLEETGIRVPKDLEGKKLAITAGDALTQLFPAFAGFNKLDTGKITLVQIDPAGKVVALLEKRVDAILGGLDDQYFLVKQKGFSPAGLSFAKNGANTVGLTILSQDATIASKPDLVRRFIAATQKSWAAAQKDPDAAINALLKAKPGLDFESQKNQLVADLPNLYSPATEGKPIGWGALSDWESTERLLKQYGNLETDKPASAFFTNDYLPQ